MIINPREISDFSNLRRDNLTPCVAGFSIRRDGHFYVPNVSCFPKGGYMFITLPQNAAFRSCNMLAGEITRTAAKIGASGAVFDAGRGQNISSLTTAVSSRGNLKLYAPYYSRAQNAAYIVSTAISGGNLRELIESCAEKFGAINTAVSCEMTRVDFLLPAMNGAGRDITLDETKRLIEKYRSPSFYSDDLEINYFGYRDRGQMHMVLYDNSGSLRRKAKLAASLGIDECFIPYAETKSIIEKII